MVRVVQPTSIEIEELNYSERRLLRKHRYDLDNLGFRFELKGSTLRVKNAIDVLGTRLTLDAELLLKIDRVGSVKDFLHGILRSKACRYAVKFGDKVNPDDCVRLIHATFS